MIEQQILLMHFGTQNRDLFPELTLLRIEFVDLLTNALVENGFDLIPTERGYHNHSIAEFLTVDFSLLTLRRERRSQTHPHCYVNSVFFQPIMLTMPKGPFRLCVMPLLQFIDFTDLDNTDAMMLKWRLNFMQRLRLI